MPWLAIRSLRYPKEASSLSSELDSRVFLSESWLRGSSGLSGRNCATAASTSEEAVLWVGGLSPYRLSSLALVEFFLRLGVGILHSMEKATQLVQGTPRLAASQRTWIGRID